MRIALAVALGSGLGGMARVLLSVLLTPVWGSHFPFGILVINIVGSMGIGFAATLAGPGGRLLVSPANRQFLLTGFFGGFTTFSFFSLQTMELIEAGQTSTALLYSGLTLVLAMLGVWLGRTVALRLGRMR